MFLLADEDLDRRAETEDREPPLTASEIRGAAEERLEGCAEELANWLAGETYGAAGSPEQCTHKRVHTGDRMHDWLDSLTTAQLLTLLHRPEREIVFQAGRRLSERFKAAHVALLSRFIDEVQS